MSIPTGDGDFRVAARGFHRGAARRPSAQRNGASAGIAAMILSTFSLPINSSDVNPASTRRDAAAKQITFRSALIRQHDLAS